MNNRAQAYVYAVNEVSLVDLAGNGSLTLEGTSQRIEMTVTGNAKYKGEKMEAGAVRANVENEANVRINAFQDLELNAKGNSRTYLYGNPKITILEFMDTSQLIKKLE